MRILFSILFILAALPALALDLRGPTLAAASNFGHWVRAEILSGAKALPVTDYRDELFWDLSQDAQGRFRFTKPVTRYPAALPSISLTVNNGHPSVDGGFTPHSADGIEGFGRHAAAMVQRFKSVHSIEVGNEFNSAHFVSGPVKDWPLEDRARLYAKLLESVHRQVKSVRPEVQIIGGGVHSPATGYLGPMFEAGALNHMDALAFHPYDTASEHLRREVAVMRRLPGAADIPLQVTEFGTTDTKAAPAFLLRHYCQMALAGVTRAAWYPLHPRGDGFEPLIDDTGAPTDLGQAYVFVENTFARKPVQDASPDEFTYACLFDDRDLVIWGASRALTLISPNLKAFDAAGHPLPAGDLRLSMDAPVILRAAQKLDLQEDISLAPQPLIADSFHQYRLPADADPGPFVLFARAADRDVALTTQPGQARPATPWTPYRGAPDQTAARAGAGFVLPVHGWAAVHRYTAPQDQNVTIQGQWHAPGSSDGITVTVTHNGNTLFQAQGKGPHMFDSDTLTLGKDDVLDFSVDAGNEDAGDVTFYRLSLRHPGT